MPGTRIKLKERLYGFYKVQSKKVLFTVSVGFKETMHFLKHGSRHIDYFLHHTIRQLAFDWHGICLTFGSVMAVFL